MTGPATRVPATTDDDGVIVLDDSDSGSDNAARPSKGYACATAPQPAHDDSDLDVVEIVGSGGGGGTRVGPRKRVKVGPAQDLDAAARAASVGPAATSTWVAGPPHPMDSVHADQIASMAAIITAALGPHVPHREEGAGGGGGGAGGGSGSDDCTKPPLGPSLPPSAPLPDPVDLHDGWLRPGDHQLRAYAQANRPSHSSRWRPRGIVWLSLRPPSAGARPVFPGPSPEELRAQWDALPAPLRTGDRLFDMCAQGSDRSGKWMLFPQAEHVDEAWVRVRGWVAGN